MRALDARLLWTPPSHFKTVLSSRAVLNAQHLEEHFVTGVSDDEQGIRPLGITTS